MADLRKQYSELRFYTNVITEAGYDITKDDYAIELKRKIRRQLYQNEVLAKDKPKLLRVKDDSYIKSYIFDCESCYKFTKPELIKYLWSVYATKVSANYSPTGCWYTAGFKVGYKGLINQKHTWLVHEIMQFDM